MYNKTNSYPFKFGDSRGHRRISCFKNIDFKGTQRPAVFALLILKPIQRNGLARKEEDPAVAMLFSCPSLGCKVLKIGKSVSRVDELPDERQAMEGIPIGEQAIQCKRNFISVFSIFPQSAADSL
jgi:hypothetical protein